MTDPVRIRALVFDLGGVLVRRDPGRAIDRLSVLTGNPPSRILSVATDVSLLEAFERGHASPEQVVSAVNGRLGSSLTLAQFAEAWNSMLSECQESTRLLPALSRQYQLAVLSNTNVLHDRHIRSSWPVFGHIRHWVVSYELGAMKPEPAIFEALLGRLGVEGQEAVYVDDVAEHVEAGRRHGMTGIHFTDGMSLARALMDHGVEVG